MALANITPFDTEDQVRAKMNAAIDVANGFENEEGRAEAAEAAIAQSVAKEVLRAEAAEAAITQAVAAIRGNLIGLPGTFRPGDKATLFTSALLGSPTASLPAANGNIAFSPTGARFDLAPGGVVAPLYAAWLEPDAFFALRVVYQRTIDPSRSEASAVNVGIQWLDASYAGLSQTLLRDNGSLLVKDGLQCVRARVPSATADSFALVPPKGAVFWRPFVEDLSRDGVLSIFSIVVSDVTDTGSYAPDVTALISRLRALENRITQLGG